MVITVLLLNTPSPCFPSTPGYFDGIVMEKAIVVVDPMGFVKESAPLGHTEHMRYLKIRALASQSRVLKFLEVGRKIGLVKSYRSYWITNAIWLEADKSIIQELAAFYEVEKVLRPERMMPVLEETPGNAPEGRSAEGGLLVMGADSLWSLGLTGLGRMVCIVDTGVDGNHPAFSDRWRGAEEGVDWSEAWFDPVGGTQFPVDENDHGTFMAGLVLGREGPDTTGVAPDAVWIAARAIGGDDFIADLLSSLQWAFDPDGDPETDDDVPDVIPFTWSFFSICDDLLWDSIDALEEAGVVVVTSAGSYGPGSETIGSPADRIESPVNCFSVGTVDGWSPDFAIASFSSRGPSGCDGQTVKPEVVSPGINVRSTVAGGGYSVWSGNSLSTAYVAGGIALLAQAEAASEVDSIKESLLYSAVDLGSPGEDNTYGWGLVNLPGALDELGGVTVAKIDLEPETGTVQQGDSLYLDYELRNPTSILQAFEAFLGVKPPVGDGFLLNRRSLSLPPVSSISGTLPLWVPMKAPPGSYELIGLTATMGPFTVIDIDTVSVTVVEAP